MQDERLPDVLRICREALVLAGAARDAYLNAACGDDTSLRREVEAVLDTPAEAAAFLDAPPGYAATTLAPGTRLGPYEVLSLIGEGGMGQVYLGRDTRLGREVAIKILPSALGSDPTRLALFLQEARTAAGLNHPHICALHDVGDQDGTRFLVMEHVPGRTLADVLLEGPLPVDRALELAAEIADALSAAHRHDVIHRDLKPSNVMVTPDGQVKVLDFGIAMHLDRPADVPPAADVTARDDGRPLRSVPAIGTAPYMSPEQVKGGTIDARSDIYSLGAVLFELLTGQRAFRRDSSAATRAAVLGEAAGPVRQLRPDVPRALDAVVARCLEKEPDRRYASAAELHEALEACRSRLPASGRRIWALLRQPQLAIPVAAVVVALFAAASWSAWRWSRGNWARTVAMPEVVRLLDQGRGCAAFRLLARAERFLPDDPEIARIRQNAQRRVSFLTDPPGADVHIRDYLDTSPDGAEDYLGRTPLAGVLVPTGHLRYRISKEGLDAAEGSTASSVTGDTRLEVRLELSPAGHAPAGMVRVPASAGLEAFWLDRFEVTNRRFRDFVDGRGYERAEVWHGPFVMNGTPLPWQRAATYFRDSTGQPGPATWANGTFPGGQDEYPVRGISWHEAAAFCAWEGKSLPTIHHWRAAALQPMFPTILLTSNFSGGGPAPVGSYGGLGPFGTYDTAGNVREWCLNASGAYRYVLGGAWNDPKYLYHLPDARPPFDRSAGNGFRCARYEGALAQELKQPLVFSLLERRPIGTPVNDTVFGAYRAIHTYERGPLEARSEGTDDGAPYWRLEKVSFRAGYGNERVTAYLFLPRNAAAPFQAVVTFPGTYAFDIRSSSRLETQWFDFIVRSGRAVIHPIYKGTYERTIGGTFATYITEPAVLRDLGLQWFKDLARSLDYLETRPDIDHARLAYHGISLGAAHGPRFMALEPRLRAGLLFWGGLGWPAAEISPINYAPRCVTPVLMINGRADLLYPWESSQVPMFRLLGASPRDKQLVVVEDAGHVAFNQEVARRALAWLDVYLGPVQTR